MKCDQDAVPDDFMKILLLSSILIILTTFAQSELLTQGWKLLSGLPKRASDDLDAESET